MQTVNIHICKAANGSTFVRVTRLGSKMILILPRFLVLRTQGFSHIEQSKILIMLAKEQEELLKKAEKDEFEIEITF